jgi:gliding motility-associated lipoprotein GldH
MVGLTSCGEQPLYEKVHSFEGMVWEQGVTTSHEVEVIDTTKLYNITVTLRTTTDYKFSNLWIFLSTELPSGKSERRPYEFRITNEDGSWIGNKTGTIVETEITFDSRTLPIKGKYIFTIEQGITHSTVDEVLDIGLRVEERPA